MKKQLSHKSAQKCSNTSDYIDRGFTEPFAMVFSRLFLKMKLHPNYVTMLSVLFGMTGGLLLLMKQLWITGLAIGLIIISIVLDCSDGQVARLGTKRSKYGRWIDGIGDTLVYTAIYVGVSIRLMSELIPFHSHTLWSWYIWIFSVIVGVFLHAGQARMADYCVVLHIHFAKGKGEFTRAKALKLEYEQTKKRTLDSMCAKSYYTYTKAQEKRTKNIQKLLDAIEQDQLKPEARDEFLKTSNHIIRITYLLTVNFRSYLLFILALCNVHFWIFPVVILVLEPIKYLLVGLYENLAKRVYQKYYEVQQVSPIEQIA